MDRLNFAIVGSSAFALRAAAATARGDVDFAGVAGSTLQGAKALADQYGVRAYADFAELLADPKVDAVWITVKDALHAPMTIAALEAGKHVLVEKPMTVSVADADVMVAAARKAGRVLHVGNHQRMRPVYRLLRSELADGRIGKIRYARFHFFFGNFSNEIAEAPSRGSLEGSGGCWVLKEFGAHMVDLLRYCTGQEPAVVSSLLKTQRYAVETEDAATITLELSEGGIAIVDVSAASHGWTHTIQVHGSEGWVHGDGIWRGHGQLTWSDGEVSRFSLDDELTPYFDQFVDFTAAVRGEPSVGATGEDGRAVLKVVEAALAFDQARKRLS